jgi:hypothetical protein
MSLISLQTPQEQDVGIWCWCLKDTYKSGLVVLLLTAARTVQPFVKKKKQKKKTDFTLLLPISHKLTVSQEHSAY